MKRKGAARPQRAAEVIGWREIVGLPDFDVPELRAKIDTGARTSALHATDLDVFERDGKNWVRFRLPLGGETGKQRFEREIRDERDIKNTSGVAERRLVIKTTLRLGSRRWQIETSLADRERMEFDLILGRTALRGHRLLVDPGRSFAIGKGATPVQPSPVGENFVAEEVFIGDEEE